MSEKWVPMVPAATLSVWVFALIMICLIAIMGVFGWFLYWSKHSRFSIESGKLVIDAGFYSRQIELKDIVPDTIGLVSFEHAPALRPTLRINGIGLPGYKAGWYRVASGEKALLHMTSQDSMLGFKTRQEYWVILSIAQAEAFALKLQQQLTKG